MEGGRAPLREARLDEAEARRAECREAARLLARRNAELLCRQRRADRDAAAVLALLTEQGREKAAQIEKLKKELIDLKQQTQEENRKLLKKSVKISSRRLHDEAVQRERRFFEEKKRLEEDTKKKLMMAREAARQEAVLQLNSIERQVFKENFRLRGASSYHLKEAMELWKMKQKLEEEKILLLQEKETQQRSDYFNSSSC